MIILAGYLVDATQCHAARYVNDDYRSESSIITMIYNLNYKLVKLKPVYIAMFYMMFNYLASIPFNQYAQLSTITIPLEIHIFLN